MSEPKVGAPTPITARNLAEALRHYLWTESRLRELAEADDEELIDMATRWLEAGEELRAIRDQCHHEARAFEIVERQADVVGRNVDWLKRHHPNDPRIPGIEGVLAGGKP